MVRATSLITFEIDSPGDASEDIKNQLASKLELLKHTAAIMICAPDFIESGAVDMICKELGFPVAGCTSATQAVNDGMGDSCLTLLVLTSDDVEFVVGRTGDLSGGVFEPSKVALEESVNQSKLELKLALLFPPILDQFAGDIYLSAFEQVCGNVPVFGAFAVTEDITVYDRCASICSGEILRCEMSYLLIFGEVSPGFIFASVSEKPALPVSGVVTESRENIVEKINSMSSAAYFESIGLAVEGKLLDGVDCLPLLVRTPGNDNKYARAMIGLNDAGELVCRGNMPPQSIVEIGSQVGSSLIETAKSSVSTLERMTDVSAAIVFSCIMRRIACGANPQIEAAVIMETLRPTLPFLFAYTGGELCPVNKKSGSVVNQFHNYSFVICTL